MKYFVILFGTVIFCVGSGFMAFFLWDINQELKFNVLLISGPIFFGYLVIKNIQNYSKIRLDKNILQVSKFLSFKTYNLDELTSWMEETNLYRVSFRKVKINFQNGSLTLIDHADPENISEPFHYLRTHYGNRMIEP